MSEPTFEYPLSAIEARNAELDRLRAEVSQLLLRQKEYEGFLCERKADLCTCTNPRFMCSYCMLMADSSKGPQE
jgi:hypothetical protein